MTRGGGRRIFGGRRNSSGVKTLPQKFGSLLATKGVFAFEARRNTNDGTNVLTFVDMTDATRILTVTGTLAKPTADVVMPSAPLTCAFTGAQNGACNKGLTPFRFMHDGTGMEVRNVYVPTSATTGVVMATRTTGTGYTHVMTSNQALMYIQGLAGALNVNGAASSALINSAVSVHDRFSSSLTPNYTHHVTGGTDATGSLTPTVDPGDPQNTLLLGSDGTNFARMRWFGSYGFLPLTTVERALVDAYVTQQTGIVSP